MDMAACGHFMENFSVQVLMSSEKIQGFADPVVGTVRQHGKGRPTCIAAKIPCIAGPSADLLPSVPPPLGRSKSRHERCAETRRIHKKPIGSNERPAISIVESSILRFDDRR